MDAKFVEKVFRTIFIFVFIMGMVWTPGNTAMAQDPAPTKIGLVTDENGIADMSFNMMAYDGLQQAGADFGIDGTLYESASIDDYGPLLQQCADEGNELCFAVGFMMADAIFSAALANPSTKFAILDSWWETTPDNLRGIHFDEKEVGYLAGALAGKMTVTNTVGAVGGWEIQPVVDFAEGYRNGAQCANPDLTALIHYTYDWVNPELGATTAQELIDQGADVIFGVAGLTGNGAILYSAQNGYWSIGIDADQYLGLFENGGVDGSENLLTSAMKKLDVAIYETIDDYLNGFFSSGTITYHLSDGGVGLADYHEADASIPQAIKDYVAGVEADIIIGNIDIHDECRPIGSSAHPIKIFFTPFANHQVILEGGTVMVDYLNQETGLYFEIIIPASPADTVLEMCAYPNDSIGFMPGIGYVLANDLCGVDVSYKAIRFGWDVYWSEVLVPRESTIVDIADLDGLTWAIPSYASTSGYLTPLVMWNDAGIATGGIVEAGDHPQAVMALYNGEVDFATAFFSPPLKDPAWQPGDDPDIPDELVNTCAPVGGELWCDGWRVMDARNTIIGDAPDVVQKLRILAISDPIANDALAFGPDLPAELRAQIESAMVTFAASEGWWDSIGRGDFYNWAGISPAVDADYDSTRAIVEVAGLNLDNWGQPSNEYYPSFSARITENQVHGYGWLLGSDVTLFIDGEEIDTQPVNEADWDPNETFVWFDLGELTLQDGQFIEMTDGNVTKTHSVTNLVVTGVDPVWDTVSGTADAGTQVEIGHIYCDEYGCFGFRREEADSNGDWTADFSVLGEDEDEQDIIDIQPGMGSEARQCDDDGDCTQYGWYVPNPHFTVYPVWKAVELWEWPESVHVTATVSGKTECFAEGDVEWYDWGTNLWMNFPEDCNVEVDDIVILAASEIQFSQEHRVRNLSITGVDVDADTVSGTADPYQLVHVWPHWYGEFEVQPTTDGDGNWDAIFPEGLLEPGIDGRSEVRDVNGNATAVDWRVPKPRFTVYPEWESVEAWDWPDGAEVAVSVDGKPECIASGTASYPEGDPSTTNTWMDFPEGCDVSADDVVTLTADEVDPQTHVVRNLSIANVDVENDTVTGTADPGTIVYVWPHGYGQFEVQPTANGDGIWDAIFPDGVLGPGIDGRSEVRDDYGNATAVDWHLPNPTIAIRANDNWIDGWEWPLDSIVTIEIDDPSTPANPDHTEYNITAYVPEWDQNTTYFEVNLNGIFDIQVGFEITATDVATTKIHKVTDLSFTSIDTDTEMVYGTATPDGWIDIWACNDDYCVNRNVEVDSSGNWEANFSTPEEDIIRFGTWIDSQEWDIDFDRTMFGMNVPPPIMGYHDYDQGDVPSFACNAGGWAMDPDDPETTVDVRISVDGSPVLTIPADGYREDLETSWNEGGGGCPGGNCAFEVSLWDYLTHYEDHEILLEAWDVQSEQWYPLGESPKTLTCRSYDIYAYDPLTGATTQITDLRNADEYNPSWSPNGKLVAHDVLAGDQHNIYITDVQTGISTPLIGAEGGNDAVWSKNGKWIAFDRAPIGDYSLYILPSEGGDATFVRDNAVSADWAPNGKRLVFQDMDGSIRTKPVNGGNGGETIITMSGANPSWSPDGNWIAYDDSGDIWKVQVNVQGTVFGDPIQVTSGPFDDQQPTWSADGLTIVYHTGLSRDYDLWSVPAIGGEPTWLTGAFEFGDYDPASAKDGSKIAYASFSPNAQAPRTWVTFFSHDLPAGTWNVGEHTYHFEWEFGEDIGSATDVTFNVAIDAELFDESYVLLRGQYLRVNTPDGCYEIDTIHPDQQARFHIGWSEDGSYTEALTAFESMVNRAVWDDDHMTEEFLHHEVFPLASGVDLFSYTCSHSMP